MTIEEILSLPPKEAIEKLKERSISVPEWSTLVKEYDQKQHAIITDKSLRPKDKVKGDYTEKVAKLTYAAEKMAVRRMVQMAFTDPVKRVYEHDNSDTSLAIEKAIEAVYSSVRINGVNINRFRAYFAACEVCTVWYVVDTGVKHNDYGFETTFKLKCRSYSPMETKFSKISQAGLYPMLDKHDDMIAFSVEYDRIEDGENVTYFETYTADKVCVWRTEGGETTLEDPTAVPIEKIPLAYISRPEPIYEGIDNNRNEIEFTLSRESDIIRKNSAPIIKIKGKFLNSEDKPATDSAREVYQLEEGGDIDTVSPVISPESTEFLVSQLKQNIEEYSQLPNLSMENVKNLGGIGFDARKTLLTDGHMKVGEEKHEIVWCLEREFSVIKAFLANMNKSWEKPLQSVKAKHMITPFVMSDEKAKSEKLSIEVGAGIKSKETAIEQLGDVPDAKDELDKINKERKQEAQATSVIDVFNTGE